MIGTFAEASQLSWLAYGDLRAHIEPCGCDPLTDLGGLRRLSAFLNRERLMNPSVVIFGLGNSLSTLDHDSIKLPFLIEAEASLKPNAVLLNTNELRNLSHIDRLSLKVPYVLTNFKKRDRLTANNSVTVADSNLLILGYTYDKAFGNMLEQVSTNLIENWRKKYADRRKTSLQRVLLFSGSEVDLSVFIDSGLFDVIISSNSASMETEPSLTEKSDETRLLRNKLHEIYMVPLGGQGVLRGGGARFNEFTGLAQVLKNNNKERNLLNGSYRVVSWLSKEVGGEDQFIELFDRYNTAARNQYSANSAKRTQDLADSPFSGAENCRSCHPQAYEVWTKSEHSGAFQTLVDRGKDKDEQCVKCHVLGLNERGGFVDFEVSPQFANVQCESCHGARKEHVKNPVKKLYGTDSGKEKCVGCHNNLHSPSFQVDKYWDKIKHHL